MTFPRAVAKAVQVPTAMQVNRDTAGSLEGYGTSKGVTKGNLKRGKNKNGPEAKPAKKGKKLSLKEQNALYVQRLNQSAKESTKKAWFKRLVKQSGQRSMTYTQIKSRQDSRDQTARFVRNMRKKKPDLYRKLRSKSQSHGRFSGPAFEMASVRKG